jgi:aminoglycoside 6'-N-acetyltransferase
MTRFNFKALDTTDLPTLHKWLNQPHVKKFYSLHDWNLEEVIDKYKNYIHGTKPVNGFIIMMDNNPMGYIQYYRVIDFGWPEQTLSEEIIQHAAGMDLFIGDETKLGNGAAIIQDFISTHIKPGFTHCIADPDIDNLAAIRCYEKLNFKSHKEIGNQRLMILSLK